MNRDRLYSHYIPKLKPCNCHITEPTKPKTIVSTIAKETPNILK